jgi:hypothetical protein
MEQVSKPQGRNVYNTTGSALPVRTYLVGSVDIGPREQQLNYIHIARLDSYMQACNVRHRETLRKADMQGRHARQANSHTQQSKHNIRGNPKPDAAATTTQHYCSITDEWKLTSALQANKRFTVSKSSRETASCSWFQWSCD